MILQLSFNFNQMQKKENFKKVEFFDVDKFKNWLVGDDGHMTHAAQSKIKTYSIKKIKR